MNYNSELSPDALIELQDAYDWYEEKELGLGERFVLNVDDAINSIELNPKGFQSRRKNYREYVIADFPYILVYEIIEGRNMVNILHVFHTSRNPKLKYKRK